VNIVVNQTVTIRPANQDECEALSQLAMRSKGYWKYSESFLAACRDELRLLPGDIAKHPTFVLALQHAIFGFYTLEHVDSCTTELGHLFVEPDAIGMGYGRMLMQHACNEARQRGYQKMFIQGDPHAEGFYLAVGAKLVGKKESASIANRYLPWFEIHLLVTPSAVSCQDGIVCATF
jgi:predicted N-acetyltransferase YhbS